MATSNVSEPEEGAVPQERQITDISDLIDLIGWMITVILADGEVELHERKFLYTFCENRGVSKQQVDDMIARAQKWGKAVELKPESPEEALAWLKSMVLAGLADGSVNEDELLVLRIAGRKLGFSDFEINRLIFNLRRQMTKSEKGTRARFFG